MKTNGITYSNIALATTASASTNTSTQVEARHTRLGDVEPLPRVQPPSGDEKTPQNSSSAPKKGTTGLCNTCKGCEASWTGLKMCHCGACHRTFSTVRLFDKHRSPVGDHGSCKDPSTITTRVGDPVMVLAGGVWRGPAMTEAQKIAKYGGVK